jgi:hypothetical protein
MCNLESTRFILEKVYVNGIRRLIEEDCAVEAWSFLLNPYIKVNKFGGR